MIHRVQAQSHNNAPHFSKAMLTIAKTNLKEFESQTDEAILIRADM